MLNAHDKEVSLYKEVSRRSAKKALAVFSILLLAFMTLGTAPAQAASAPSVSEIDVMSVDTNSAEISLVANADGLTPILSLQISRDYSFQTPEATESIMWTPQLDNQDHEFLVSLTELEVDALYFVRAVLSTSVGTFYSDLAAFRTLPPVGIVINDGATHTNLSGVLVIANAPANAVAVQLSNTNNMLASIESPLDEPIEWQLSQVLEGESASVYGRFVLPNNQFSAVFSDEIVFDAVAPTMSGLLYERIGSTLVLTQSASDAGAGVSRIEIKYGDKTVSRPFSEALELDLSSLPGFAQAAPGTPLRVRALDRASNASAWYNAAARVYPKPVLSIPSFATSRHTVILGDWGSEATFEYQWMRNAKPITGATSATYTHAVADFGAKLSLQLKISKRGNVIATRTTAAITVIHLPVITKGATVSGKAKVGQLLKIATVTAIGYPKPKVTYRWLRCNKPTAKVSILDTAKFGCKAISGATKSTYKLTSADVGKYVVANTVATGTSAAVKRVFAKSTAKVVR
jgi:hypothetical protein